MSNDDPTSERAGFRAMSEGTTEHWQKIVASSTQLQAGLADRVLDYLRLLDGDFGGFLVDRLTHCLQTATRAERDATASLEGRCRRTSLFRAALLGGHRDHKLPAEYGLPDRPFSDRATHWTAGDRCGVR